RTLGERGVLGALDEEHQEQLRLEQRGRLAAETVGLFRKRPLHWVPALPGTFLLTLGDHGTLLLEQTGPTWRVLHRQRDGITLIAKELPLDYAQGTGEDYARRLGVGTLVDPAAAWRRAPATARQLEVLRRWRITAPAGLTRGEASDLLSAAFARVGDG